MVGKLGQSADLNTGHNDEGLKRQKCCNMYMGNVKRSVQVTSNSSK